LVSAAATDAYVARIRRIAPARFIVLLSSLIQIDESR